MPQSVGGTSIGSNSRTMPDLMDKFLPDSAFLAVAKNHPPCRLFRRIREKRASGAAGKARSGRRRAFLTVSGLKTVGPKKQATAGTRSGLFMSGRDGSALFGVVLVTLIGDPGHRDDLFAFGRVEDLDPASRARAERNSVHRAADRLAR